MKYLLMLVLLCSTVFGKNLAFEGLGYEDLNITDTQVCPVKQVTLPKNRDFIGVVVYKDNSFDVTSSPKYTFKQMHHVQNTKEKEVAKVYVTDYKTKKLIDTQNAYYVFGSTLMSVGGDDIIPFAKQQDAQEFMQTYKGKKIYTIERMSEKFIDFLEIR
jgi:nitrous oxide reductase accessory protein NosL